LNINDLVDELVNDQEGQNVFTRLRSGAENLKKPFFLSKIRDPFTTSAFTDNLVFGYQLKNHDHFLEKQFNTCRKWLLLGSAYELQENKFYAVNSYKNALRNNPECFEAFDSLTRNNLLIDSEKRQLIEELKFTNKQLWVKDFYLSKIDKQVVGQDEHSYKPQGIVQLKVSEEDNMQLQIQFKSENYGVSPIRIKGAFETDHYGESLRAPK